MKKSRFIISVICIIIFFAFFLFSDYIDFGKIKVVDTVNTEVNFYTDLVSVRNTSKLYLDKINGYKFIPSQLIKNSEVTSDNILFASHPNNILKYENTFENKEIVAYSTIIGLYNNSFIDKSKQMFVGTKNAQNNTAYINDLYEIMIGFTKGASWEDLGYYGSKPIKLYIPNKNSKDYDYVVLGIYSVFFSETQDKAKSIELTKKIINMAEYYNQDKTPKMEEIYILYEQSPDFISLRSNSDYAYPTTSILFPVYMFWSNEAFDKVFYNLTEKYDNCFVNKSGYRPANDSQFFSKVSCYEWGDIWAARGVDSIDSIEITTSEMNDVLVKILE